MVTSNVDAVYDSHVGNHARFVSHDIVDFVFSVSIRAFPSGLDLYELERTILKK